MHISAFKTTKRDECEGSLIGDSIPTNYFSELPSRTEGIVVGLILTADNIPLLEAGSS